MRSDADHVAVVQGLTPRLLTQSTGWIDGMLERDTCAGQANRITYTNCLPPSCTQSASSFVSPDRFVCVQGLLAPSPDTLEPAAK